MAYLTYYPGPHLREELIEFLWPDAPPDAGRNRLSQAVAWLRPRLEPEGVAPQSVLYANRTSLALVPGSTTSDAAEINTKHAVTANVGNGLDSRIRALEELLALYRGDLLPGEYYDWVIHERQRLAELRLGSLVHVSDLLRTRDNGTDLQDAEQYARKAVALDGLREESHLALMRVLAARGQIAAARRQFHILKGTLATQLAENPSASALAFQEQLHRHDAEQSLIISPTADDMSFTLPGQSSAAFLPPLPTPLTRFFGREPEIAEALDQLTGDTRLLTLLGPGGSGKTRLSLEVARRLSAATHAVVFVSLADLTDATQILTEIARTLHQPNAPLPSGETTPPDALGQIRNCFARFSSIVLLLDNLEHLSDGAAPVLKRLLDTVPALNILTTSRQRLALSGERELWVLPLPLPNTGTPASEDAASLRLFVDRAQLACPSFALTDRNRATITALCTRLEGLPLAIELCTAWASILTPTQMLAELDNRFALLTTAPSDFPDRHRSLRAAIEYSFALLPEDLKRVFISLSVFRGGWTLEAATAVCQSNRDTMRESLLRLRERSLLWSEASGIDDSLRFRMLETMREFGISEQRTMVAMNTVAQEHATYFVNLAESLEGKRNGAELSTTLTHLEAEHDNLRAALHWCLTTPGFLPLGLRFGAALWYFWMVRGYVQEGIDKLSRLLQAVAREPNVDIPTPLRVRVSYAQARLLYAAGDHDDALSAAQQTLALARDAQEPGLLASALHLRGIILARTGDYVKAQQAHAEGVAEARESGNPAQVALSLHDLGMLSYLTRDWDTAQEHFTESRRLFQEQGHLRSEAIVLNSLGLVARHRRNDTEAQDYFREALKIRRTLTDKAGIAISLLNLGTVARLQATPKTLYEARTLLQEALQLAQATGSRYILAWCLKESGHLLIAEADYATGVRFLGAADSLRASLGATFQPADPDEREQDLSKSCQAIGTVAVDAAWEAGRSAPLEYNIAIVIPRTSGGVSPDE